MAEGMCGHSISNLLGLVLSEVGFILLDCAETDKLAQKCNSQFHCTT